MLQPLVYKVDPRQPVQGSRFVDITGMYDGFDVIKYVGFSGCYSVYLCRCHCGNEFVRRANSILHRGVQTCGKCSQPEKEFPRLYRHWLKHRDDMVDSLANNFSWFVEFFSDGGDRESLCKLVEELPHSETNSVWRMGSTKRSVVYNGRRTTLKDIAADFDITRERMRQRIRDWGIDEATSTPGGLSRKGTSKMPLASTNISADEHKRLRALSFITDENVSTIIKRLVQRELDEHKDAIDVMLTEAEKNRSIVTK